MGTGTGHKNSSCAAGAVGCTVRCRGQQKLQREAEKGRERAESGQRAKAEWRHQHTRHRGTWRVSVVVSRAREARPSCQVHGHRTGKMVGAGFGSGTVAMVGSSGLSRKMLSMVTDPLC